MKAMTWDNPKSSPNESPSPRPLSWIVVFLGVLALFLICASGILASYPVGSTVRQYFYGIDRSRFYDISVFPVHESSTDVSSNGSLDLVDNEPSSSDRKVAKTATELNSQELSSESASSEYTETSTDKVDSNLHAQSDLTSNSPLPVAGTISSNVTVNVTIEAPTSAALMNDPGTLITTSNDTSKSHPDSVSTAVPASSNESYSGSVNSGCNLFHGTWLHDSLGPLYRNDSCPVLTQMQNCQGNGRPDKDYENWRWKPFQCDIPRLDPRKFLEVMRGKTLAFIGDSVARNQMESMMCILWQVETPKNNGNRNMQRFYFKSTSVTIIRIWSSWLVKHSSEPFDYAPEGVDKLFLDIPDEKVMEFLPKFDVVVLSSGHWFAKQSVYVLNNEIVGGQLWWPDKSRPMKINNVEAFGISVETMFTALAMHPNFTGLAILRSYSPDHYEGGAWNTGGSCTGKVKPLGLGELVENGHTNAMYEQQVKGFNHASKKATNGSKLLFMDITEAFSYRHDGHPGPFRNKDPNKITVRGPDGKPPPQDCLHWCMPGPVDTWNEILFEMIKREFEGGNAS
ncbi:protein YLS7 [Arachis stenosperma]|uniref:protein YLS7 n=1 Tax=Arachis stenosperma TaxID=217475 RepID=UPI0025AD035B|nr:protein YLS7 [Arachis stenosperma]XP_057759004.1 protein YLS7 [Arachis stenosperma]